MNDQQEKITERIAKLLAKAESTNSQHEADALISKAQALMTEHAIDEMMVKGRNGASESDTIETRAYRIQAPYEKAKAMLYTAIAKPNGCRAVQKGKSEKTVNWDTGKKSSVLPLWLTGYKSDLDMVEAMYNSLSIQCVREMMKAVQPVGVNTKSFRHGFQMGYAQEIYKRLNDAKAETVQAAKQTYTSESVGLAIIEKDKAVERAYRDQWSDVRIGSVNGGSSGAREGRSAGKDAGSRAGFNASVGSGGRRALEG